MGYGRGSWSTIVSSIKEQVSRTKNQESRATNQESKVMNQESRVTNQEPRTTSQLQRKIQIYSRIVPIKKAETLSARDFLSCVDFKCPDNCLV